MGTLAPVIGLVQVGNQAWADRYTYVPLIGLFIMVAWGARDLTAGQPGARVLRVLGAGIVLTVLLVCTMLQVRLWRDSVTLFEHTLRVTGDNPVIHNNLGVALAAQGKMELAAPHFLEALRLDPNNARAQNKLGEELFAQGKIAEAAAKFQKASKLKPDLAAAHNNLGRVYAHEGKMDEAMARFQKAIDLEPNFAAAYKNLGLALASRGEKQKAVEMLTKAVELNPNDPEAQQILQILKTQGK
ncbi:MAG: tetratricopeptide repeat protein [Deltaproteobacteria bacterium]|nr:tetratricopeptide repeat protein [Deltaproteobacteria bacterium]